MSRVACTILITMSRRTLATVLLLEDHYILTLVTTLLWLLVGVRVNVEEAQHGLRRGTPRLALAARRVPAVLGPEDRRRGSRLRQAVESGWGGALLGCDTAGDVAGVCVGNAQALGRD